MPHIEYETGIFVEKFLCVCEVIVTSPAVHLTTAWNGNTQGGTTLYTTPEGTNYFILSPKRRHQASFSTSFCFLSPFTLLGSSPKVYL